MAQKQDKKQKKLFYRCCCGVPPRRRRTRSFHLPIAFRNLKKTELNVFRCLIGHFFLKKQFTFFFLFLKGFTVVFFSKKKFLFCFSFVVVLFRTTRTASGDINPDTPHLFGSNFEKTRGIWLLVEIWKIFSPLCSGYME